MTRLTMAAAVAAVTLGLVTASPRAQRWEGVDKAVIEKVAEDAGHPAAEPLIDTEQGDLLLFLFLLAGAAGGFVAGYAFRGLFPPRKGAR
jgi:ABC-type cobalt transport system substrate-binding protein